MKTQFVLLVLLFSFNAKAQIGTPTRERTVLVEHKELSPIDRYELDYELVNFNISYSTILNQLGLDKLEKARLPFEDVEIVDKNTGLIVRLYAMNKVPGLKEGFPSNQINTTIKNEE